MGAQEYDKPIVTRLAPTPSGFLHAGNIFSFLVCWLYARQRAGRVVLRIEDLDVPRCKPEFVKQTIDDLLALGLTWDNETIMYQSKRTSAYDEALGSLVSQGCVYPCFCSRADLLASSAPHEGERSVYAGTCRPHSMTSAGMPLSSSEPENGSASDRTLFRESVHDVYTENHPFSLRCAVPAVDVFVQDLFQGEYFQNLARECGDFIIKRKDGLYGYQLAVVVDDIAQGVNTVIRGVDLLSSAPQQLYVRSLLTGRKLASQVHEIRFGHTPLVVTEEGRRLAKRSGDRGVSTLVQRCGSVPALLGRLSYAFGLISSADDITADELIEEADLSALYGQETILADMLP